MTAAVQFDLLAPRWSAATTTVRAAAPIPYADPFAAAIAPALAAAGDDRLRFDEATWFDRPGRATVIVDVETFANCFIACFYRIEDGARVTAELSARSRFDAAAVTRIMRENTIVTFNGGAYDVPMLRAAVAGRSARELKELSDRIIAAHRGDGEGRPRYERSTLDHVDLIESNPSVRQGLKMLHARLHGRFLVDLPFDPGAWLTAREMNVATLYCLNDLDGTRLVFDAMREPLALRAELGALEGVDLRSRSDAQIGEAMVKRRVERRLGRRLARPDGTATVEPFRYVIPDFIRLTGERTHKLLTDLADVRFEVGPSGKVKTPPFLENLTVRFGSMTYAMGIGGLHSTEEHRGIVADEQTAIVDVDVASQYPNIILKLGLYPPAIGPAFLEVYRGLVEARLAAKAAGDVVRAEGGKIAVNGVYGKLGSPYSILYDPRLLIATTLTGQLSILMLIERADDAGFRAVSANTDGVVFLVERARMAAFDAVVRGWEADVGLVTERQLYRSLHSASVNGYVAIREDGKIKRKGPNADPWREGNLREMMKKNPAATIVGEAVVRLIADGTPIEKTIRAATDPREFVSVIKVTGGAVWRGHRLGRLVRYYWSTDGEAIRYASNGNKVGKSDGARPMLELSDALPADVDYLRYCEETVRLAAAMGVKEIR